jgi:DNA-binding CsgD family transcriptional regulator
MLRNQRQNAETSRAGLKWESYEDNQMLSLVSEGKSLADIAKVLQRTEGSIKTRLIIYALNRMDKDSLSLAQAAEMVNLEESDITEYQDKKQAREERLKERKSSGKTDRTNKMSRRTGQERPAASVTNADIYDLLLSMNRSLDTLVSRR